MNKIIVVTGPTGTGKTELSIKLAKEYNGEIINADSTQVYKDANIATAKVTFEETEGIKHHLLSSRNLEENYTVFDYQAECRQCIEEIKKRSKTVIIVGGTGLYIKATLYNYSFTKNDTFFDDKPYNNQELYNILLKYDPNTNIHINNRIRVINAIKYSLETNKPYSEKEITTELLYDTVFIGLTAPREILYRKLDNRVDKMVNFGLLEEAEHFYKTIYLKNKNNKNYNTIIGYKEFIPYFKDIDTLENCLNKIKQTTRNYAKKQFTWFNNQMDINWFETNYENFSATKKEVLNFLSKID